MYNTIKLWCFAFFFTLWNSPKIMKLNRSKEDAATKNIKYQNLMHMFAKKFLKVAKIDVEVIGEANIDYESANLYVANHTSIIDPFFIYGGVNTSFSFFVASEFSYFQDLPFIGKAIKHMNNVYLDRSSVRNSVKAINDGVENLKNNLNLLIFPEGQITHILTKDYVGDFKSGSFKTALKAKTGVIPMAIIGGEKIQHKVGILGKINPGKVKIVIHPKLKYSEIKDMTSSQIAKKCQQLIRKDFENDKIKTN